MTISNLIRKRTLGPQLKIDLQFTEEQWPNLSFLFPTSLNTFTVATLQKSCYLDFNFSSRFNFIRIICEKGVICSRTDMDLLR